ncbi:MAG: hypothetical protein UW63_C0008G0023 [Candidatus Uhrbacteria bacterium GW2011_GWF2_44_350]|uniref:O-antigen ligase-related domain-containing protein n=1 Tax=Candidatus Uhrbacteria bacterium GW2011_GWF2_44_350 TaxID=1619000 RepID=A0A0G1LSJ4_9BACT|nr:MAG: hypothetical protein UW63_C0008G0023 [Candidatus Uhrbacteria bacterium GW2011_GWF2_44_350]
MNENSMWGRPAGRPHDHEITIYENQRTGALAGFFLIALGVFHNFGEPIALVIIGLGVFALTLWKLEFGIFVAFAELFANSHGHLISTSVGGFSLSLRMVVFLVVMLAWVGLLIFKKTKLSLKDNRLIWFAPLFVAVIIGYTVGFSQNDFRQAFDDGNAYFYLAYLFPILSIEWNNSRLRILLQVFAAAAIWVVILTLGLLYEFTHFPAWMLSRSYTFIRDTRTGELTRMTDSIFRIFLQAQFSPIALTFLLAPWLWLKDFEKKSRFWLVLILSCLVGTILIGLSRSFWVGILLGLVPFIILLIKLLKPGFKKLIGSAGLGASSGLIGAVILVLIILFPLPYRMSSAGELSSLFSSRAGDLGDVAISSRWNLLPEMWQEVVVSPILGSGFGEEVTFKTDDPRARSISPDGTWTTHAFEWGWLDLWLKMGLLGPLAFLWLFYGLLRGLLTQSNRPAWLTVGLVSSLVMLYATHIFSPYLNHPIGLGFILLVVPFLETENKFVLFRLPQGIRLESRPANLSSAQMTNSRLDVGEI